MAFFDFPEDQLRSYTGAATKPDDFESFWLSTLEEQPTDLDVQVEKVEFPVAAYEVFDVSFLGYGGARIHSWVRVPRGEDPDRLSSTSSATRARGVTPGRKIGSVKPGTFTPPWIRAPRGGGPAISDPRPLIPTSIEE